MAYRLIGWPQSFPSRVRFGNVNPGEKFELTHNSGVFYVKIGDTSGTPGYGEAVIVSPNCDVMAGERIQVFHCNKQVFGLPIDIHFVRASHV